MRRFDNYFDNVSIVENGGVCIFELSHYAAFLVAARAARSAVSVHGRFLNKSQLRIYYRGVPASLDISCWTSGRARVSLRML